MWRKITWYCRSSRKRCSTEFTLWKGSDSAVSKKMMLASVPPMPQSPPLLCCLMVKVQILVTMWAIMSRYGMWINGTCEQMISCQSNTAGVPVAALNDRTIFIAQQQIRRLASGTSIHSSQSWLWLGIGGQCSRSWPCTMNSLHLHELIVQCIFGTYQWHAPEPSSSSKIVYQLWQCFHHCII